MEHDPLMSIRASIRMIRQQLDAVEQKMSGIESGIEDVSSPEMIQVPNGLTPSEFRLLRFMRRGSVASYDGLVAALYAHRPHCDWPEDPHAVLTVHMSRMRRKGVRIRAHALLGYELLGVDTLGPPEAVGTTPGSPVAIRSSVAA